MKHYSSKPEPSKSLEVFQTLKRQHLPSPTRAIAWILCFTIAFLIGFMVFVPWVQTANGVGTITALDPDDRAQQINALVSGRIKRWFVQEGSRVSTNDPIVEIIDNDERLLERLKAEIDALRQNVEVARIAAETAKIDQERKRELFEQGLSSRRDYEQARIRYKSLLAEESKARAELNKAEVKFSRQDTQILRAPRDGIIVRIIAGDIATFVKEGQAVATFVPSNVIPAAELYVSGLNIPLIQPGRKVRLQFEGWPAVQFSGWPATAIGTFGGVVKVVDPSVAENGKFRIIVTPDPDDQPWPDERFLRLGAQVEGWVLLDTVSVGYELWRQLNNFPPRQTNPDAKGMMTP